MQPACWSPQAKPPNKVCRLLQKPQETRSGTASRRTTANQPSTQRPCPRTRSNGESLATHIAQMGGHTTPTPHPVIHPPGRTRREGAAGILQHEYPLPTCAGRGLELAPTTATLGAPHHSFCLGYPLLSGGFSLTATNARFGLASAYRAQSAGLGDLMQWGRGGISSQGRMFFPCWSSQPRMVCIVRHAAAVRTSLAQCAPLHLGRSSPQGGDGPAHGIDYRG